MTDPYQPTAAASVSGQAAASAASQGVVLPERYQLQGWLGRGGMGEVRLVFDTVLERPVAMKIIRGELAEDPAARARFLREGRITAGLGHPSIIAVHDQGVLGDGRVWYTMQAIEGQTLAEVLPTLSLRRAVEILVRVAQAIGYAHRSQILHRDLKPSNIMVGAFGEVLVLDWGLARRQGEDSLAGVAQPSPSGRDITQFGQVMGTPAYMSPEQAAGHPVDGATDVFALGGVLHTILHGGPPGRCAIRPDVPDALTRVCLATLAPEPQARPDALALADQLQSWLDDALRRAEAQALLDTAHALRDPIDAARARAKAAEAQAAALLKVLPPHTPVSEKRDGWRLEEQAQAARREVALLEVELLQKARAALERDPSFDAAHATLADLYRHRAEQAEAARNLPLVEEAMALLRRHDRGAHAAWLEGTAPLTVHVAAPQAHLTLRTLESVDRRLVPGAVLAEGPAPWIERSIPAGNYQLCLAAPGHAAVSMPVRVERATPWHAGPPDEPDRPLRLPKRLAAGEVFVPAGWCIVGDPTALDGHPPRRIWIDAFIMQRYAITNREYIEFLDGLVATGRSGDAERAMPLEEGGVAHQPRPLYLRDAQGKHHLAKDGFGQVWHAEQPAVSMSWHCATLYAQWRSTRDGLTWRLPHALEWEKAARGADGRIYPWGDHFEPTWTCALHTFDGPPRRVGVDQTPLDVSPYGVVGLAGNARDWCASGFLRAPPEADHVLDPRVDADDPFRAVRGGAMLSVPAFCKPGARFGMMPGQRRATVGMRLVRDL